MLSDEPETEVPDGPIRQTNPEDVPTEGAALLEGFEWVTMDLSDDAQVMDTISPSLGWSLTGCSIAG